MEELSFHLNVFHGPLDLLLHLISKNKVSIYDIPIAMIFEQYMEYLSEAREQNIELTSEFAAMAARLLYIKSKMLLPVYEEEPEEDPRAPLVEMLAEYQKIKNISAFFGSRWDIGRDMFIKQAEPAESEARYGYRHGADELAAALLRMKARAGLKMPPPLSSFTASMGRERAPVGEQMQRLLHAVAENGRVSFRQALRAAGGRSEQVAVFLAVLELVRVSRIDFLEAEDGDYLLVPAVPDGADAKGAEADGNAPEST